MLDNASYIDKFLKLQRHCMDATLDLAEKSLPGTSELALANRYKDYFADHDVTEEWYPTLICAGRYSGQPLTRRNHLPDGHVKIRQDDVVILDCTPLQGTVWDNWTVTKAIGNDPFYRELCDDLFACVMETTSKVLTGEIDGLAAIHSSVTRKAESLGLKSIDPRANVGHSIFQVPEGQTVDLTPESERIFIDQDDMEIPAQSLISIEPELARINPEDGIQYGGKFQFIIPFGYDKAGEQLIADQFAFYKDFAAIENSAKMRESLSVAEDKLNTSHRPAQLPPVQKMKL
jgi:hypothetical protein